MTIIQKYIAKTIVAYTLLVTLIIVGVNFFISLVGELQDIGVGYYGFPAAVLHSLLRIPFDLYQFFPVNALLGSILGLGLLASHQELTVMRTSGLSFKKILIGVIAGSIILISLITIIGEGISPSANLLAQKWKGSAKNGGQAVVTASGIWAHEGNNFFHIEQVLSKHHLGGVSRYEFDANHHLLAAYYANNMDYDHGSWQLHHLVKTNIENNKVTSEQIPEATWTAILSPSLLSVGMIEPDEMSIRNLFLYGEHLKQNGLQATEFQFSFWKRIFQPLATLVMIFLALPCVMNITRTASVGARIFMGAIIGIAFFMLSAFLGQVSVVYQVSPWLAALMPILLFAGLGYVVAIKLIR